LSCGFLWQGGSVAGPGKLLTLASEAGGQGALQQRTMEDATVSARPPLCVDLDGTLVRTDMLAELLLAALRHCPLCVVLFPVWLFKGKAHAKSELAARVCFNPSLLPYRQSVLDLLVAERSKGRHLFLTTASDRRIANAIADHLGLFDDVLASDGTTNLKGRRKAERLVSEFGQGRFEYIGDSISDLVVWASSGGAVCVNAGAGLSKCLPAGIPVSHHRDGRDNPLFGLLKAMRMYQWVKNLLVFVAPLAAHNLFLPSVLAVTVALFFAFGLTASGVYIVNDLMDLDADRAHPRKRGRPFASGRLSIGFGVAGPALMIGGVLIGFAISWVSGVLIIGYIVLTTAYTLYLKEQPLVDVFTLAALYTFRLLAGGVAVDATPSVWLLSFSGFLFLGLAFIKRAAELADVEKGGALKRRGYSEVDGDALRVMGVTSSFTSCVVLALYINSDAARLLYPAHEVLWFLVPLALFWQLRLWLSTYRNYMHDDPIIYAAKDWVSWIVVLFGLAVYIGAVFWP